MTEQPQATGTGPVAPQNPVQQTQTQAAPKTASGGETKPKERKSKTIWWVLGGCCLLLVIGGILLLIFGYRMTRDIADELGTEDTQEILNELQNQLDDTSGGTTSSGTGEGAEITAQGEAIISTTMSYEIDQSSGAPVRPTSVFTTEDAVYNLAIELANAPKMDIKVEWNQDGSFVDSYEFTDVEGDGYVNFFLDVSEIPSQRRVGNYEATIYIDDTLYDTVLFSVTE